MFRDILRAMIQNNKNEGYADVVSREILCSQLVPNRDIIELTTSLLRHGHIHFNLTDYRLYQELDYAGIDVAVCIDADQYMQPYFRDQGY
jgi:hypothetical protein